MSWINFVLVIALLLTLGLTNTITWAITRIRNRCRHYTPRHALPAATREVTR